MMEWNKVLKEVRNHLEKLPVESAFKRAFWTGGKMTLLPFLWQENLAYDAAMLHSQDLSEGWGWGQGKGFHLLLIAVCLQQCSKEGREDQ